jgi:hypothetical protein
VISIQFRQLSPGNPLYPTSSGYGVECSIDNFPLHPLMGAPEAHSRPDPEGSVVPRDPFTETFKPEAISSDGWT